MHIEYIDLTGGGTPQRIILLLTFTTRFYTYTMYAKLIGRERRRTAITQRSQRTEQSTISRDESPQTTNTKGYHFTTTIVT